LWCPLRFQHKTIFGSFLLPVVCRRVHVLYLCLFVHSGIQHVLTMRSIKEEPIARIKTTRKMWTKMCHLWKKF
jgi:hypothetical protein